MSRIVLGIGASHSTLMNTNWDEVAHQEDAQRFRAGLGEARELVEAARPDAVVVIGSNHFRGFFLDLMPAFTVGVAECVGSGESGTPGGPLPVDTELARKLMWSLSDADFDAAFSLRLQVDHGITHALQYLLPDLDVPIVPVVMNMFAPPLPSLARCDAFGAELRRAIESDGQDKRVLVVASGGLSHRLPWPKWFSAMSDDDRFLVEAWLNGRDSWKDYEVRRRQIILAAESDINPEFDRRFLELLLEGDLSEILAKSAAEIEAEAGNGAQEIRSWVAMSRAVGPAKGRVLAYEPIDKWITGMAVAALEPLPGD
ncbi:AmmeMemoRadiSam system protein B [Streptosporangium sp. NPDC006013]|uniref:AmmeMemoRadiSam system protein B n=1 Tax=Streptosporangium sp. NPDC006013 TaxID=3155596 RepID=UPI0033AEFCE1